MCSMSRHVGISDAATIQYIRNGLNNNSLRNVIAGMHFNSCLDLYAILYRYEDNLPSRYDSSRGTIGRPGNIVTTRTTNPLDRHDNERRDVRCYNCKEPGHLSISCPQPQRRIRCPKCQRSGHALGTVRRPETGEKCTRHLSHTMGTMNTTGCLLA